MKWMLARAATSGLVLACLIGWVLWYRGDLGQLSLMGRAFAPPGVTDSGPSLRALEPGMRAAGFSQMGPQSLAPDALAEFYLGHVIAKPLRAPLGFEGNAQSAAGAIEAAQPLGSVRSAMGGAFFIELDDRYRAGVDPMALDAVETYRGEQCDDGLDPDRLADDPAYGVSCAIARLRSSGQFEFVERDYIVSLATNDDAPVDDPLFGYQWALSSPSTEAGAAPGGAGFSEFWRRASRRGSASVNVAVIDNGVDFTHPHIAESPNLIPGLDVISQVQRAGDEDARDQDPSDSGEVCYDSFSDPVYHGTQIAGLIGAVVSNDQQGIAGAAWDISIAPIRAVGACGGLMSDVSEAIIWASGAEWLPVVDGEDGHAFARANAHPADIINVSVSFPAPEGCPRSLQGAIDTAIDEGALVVAPAGNNGGDAGLYAPGNCENVITVAASDYTGALAAYSNAGEAVTIMAPGGDLAADQNADGWPDGILTTARAFNCTDLIDGASVGECFHILSDGTSLAAAHVTAALALLSAEFPDADRDELLFLLLEKSRRQRSAAQCPGGCGAGLLDLSRATG